MKTAPGLGLLLIAVVAFPAGAIHYDVASCAELGNIDNATVTSLTIINSPFECDSYTRFPVLVDLILKFDSTSTAPAALVLTNFALQVKGTLTVDPDVVFQGVTEQVSVKCVLHQCRFFIGRK